MTPEEIEILSSEYLEDLESEGVTPRQFEWAARHVSRRCRFFPKMADILDAVDMYRANPPRSDKVAIAYDPVSELTPEQVRRGEEALRVSKFAIANKISFKDAEEILFPGKYCVEEMSKLT